MIYTNTNTGDIIRGSEFKLNINMDSIPVPESDEDIHMRDLDDFKCIFFCGGKSVTLCRDDMIEINEDNYVAPLNSLDFGIGTIQIRFEADIPDNHFDDDSRHEIAIIDTNIKIIEPWVA